MSLTPGRVNFLCPQGSTFNRRLTYKIEDVPVNLTGYSSRLQVREAHYATSTLVSLTSGSGITLGGSAGNFVYDLEVQAANGTVDRLVEGSFIVSPEVTR
jgi:hypothetical protein